MTKKITQVEMDRRESIAQTDANNRLEGIEPPIKNSLEWRLREQWARGEITTQERISALKNHSIK